MAKKQTKANKAFIAKISTLNIGKKNSETAKSEICGCGAELKPVGHLKGEFHGKEVEGIVYAHGPVPPGAFQRRQRKPQRDGGTEQISFSA